MTPALEARPSGPPIALARGNHAPSPPTPNPLSAPATGLGIGTGTTTQPGPLASAGYHWPHFTRPPQLHAPSQRPPPPIDLNLEAPADLRSYSLASHAPPLAAPVTPGAALSSPHREPVVTPSSSSGSSVSPLAPIHPLSRSPVEEKDHLADRGLLGRREGRLRLGTKFTFPPAAILKSPQSAFFATPSSSSSSSSSNTTTPDFSTPSSTGSHSSSGLFSPLPTPGGLIFSSSYPFQPFPPASQPATKPALHHSHHQHLRTQSQPYIVPSPDAPPPRSHSKGRIAKMQTANAAQQQQQQHQQHPPYFLDHAGGHPPASAPIAGSSSSPISSTGAGGGAGGSGPGTPALNGHVRSERGVGPAAERERERGRRPQLSGRVPSAPAYTLNTLKRDRDGDPLGASAGAGTGAGAGAGAALSSIREATRPDDRGFFPPLAPQASNGASTLHHVQSLPVLNGGGGGAGGDSSTMTTWPIDHRTAPGHSRGLSGASSSAGGAATPSAAEAAVLDLDALYSSLRVALLQGRDESAVVESTHALRRKVEEVIGKRRAEDIAAMEAMDQLNSMDVDGPKNVYADAIAKSSSLSRRPSVAPLQPPPLPPAASSSVFHSQSTPVVPMQHQFATNPPMYADPPLGHSTFATPAASAQTAGIHLPPHMMVHGAYPHATTAGTGMPQQHVPQGMGITMTPIAPPSAAPSSSSPTTTTAAGAGAAVAGGPSRQPPPPNSSLQAHIRQASAAAHSIIHSTPPSPGLFRAQYDGPIGGHLGVTVPAPLQQTHAAAFLPSTPSNELARRAANLSQASTDSLRELHQQHAAAVAAAAQMSPATNGSSPAISRRNTNPIDLSRPPSRAVSDSDMMAPGDDLSSPTGTAFGSSSAAAVAAAKAQANAPDAPLKGAGSQMGAATAGVEPELQEKLDPIFFNWLGKLCSDLEMTDGKGELIHQTLMAKKMQRLDESIDFRPFKFRIQAFTNGFHEELIRHGFTEHDLPLKKVRQYLWSQTCISRFNEEGRKAKSKGNHVWHIEAKKVGTGEWEFMQFTRKIVGRPAKVAYCGIKWVWAPRVWDPQCAVQSIKAVFSSPVLPAWLAWKDNVLSGIPPADGPSVDITAHARFTQNGRQQQLEYSFHLLVTPIDGIEHHREQLDSFSYSNVNSATSSARSTPRHSPEPQAGGPMPANPLAAGPSLRHLAAAGLVRTESGNNYATAGAPDAGLGPQEVKHEILDPASSSVGIPMLASASLLPGVADAITQALEQPMQVQQTSLGDVNMMPAGLAQQNAILEANMQAQNMAAALHDAHVTTLRNNLLSADQNVSATASSLISQAIESQDPAQQQLAADVLAPLSASRPPTASAATGSSTFPMAVDPVAPAPPPPQSAATTAGMAVDPSVLLGGPGGAGGQATAPLQQQPTSADPAAMAMAMDFDLATAAGPQNPVTAGLVNPADPTGLLGDLSRPPSDPNLAR